MKKKVYVVAHTHWDFEWYFSRQEAQVQLIYHMDDVFEALRTNRLAYYVLDGQMAIVDDYLAMCPDKREILMKYVQAGRLFIGPWYTQVDEMTTSGESMVRNLQLGIRAANELGGTMNIGYLPDSFGQSQDIPKLYSGFDIKRAIFWRGMPKEKDAVYFNWEAKDGSKVLAAVLKNGYYAGATWMDSHVDMTNDKDAIQLLPVGGDQRAVDWNLNDSIQKENRKDDRQFIPSHYEAFFDQIEKVSSTYPVYQGEFVDPSLSKIHRGIYDSRADLKQLYDELERLMTYQVEPLMIMAKETGLAPKQDACANVWKTIARGQAHDSGGACNSDKTNQDIYQRGLNAKQTIHSLIDAMLRKMAETRQDEDLIIWNTRFMPYRGMKKVDVSTKVKTFAIYDEEENVVPYTVLAQRKENRAYLRANPEEQTYDNYYVTTIMLPVNIPAMDWQGFVIKENENTALPMLCPSYIENHHYRLEVEDGQINVYYKPTKMWFKHILTVEDSGDDGDNYDYSPPANDWKLDLNFADAKVEYFGSDTCQWVTLKGQWRVPANMVEREAKQATQLLPYQLTLWLQDDAMIRMKWMIDNRGTFDHRLRIVWHTPNQVPTSVQDTPFGMVERPMNDEHLADWREIGYKEEPTSLHPFIHLTNFHDEHYSYTFYGLGEKCCQQIALGDMAITLYRSVGYLGKPDLVRRPGDASGLQNRYVVTPDSQLQKEMIFEGAFSIDEVYQPALLQQRYQDLQPTLSYQRQKLNAYTTPLQYFQSHPAPKCMHHQNLGDLVSDKLVISSVVFAPDGEGIVLRMYNPSEHLVDAPGTLKLSAISRIYRVNLNDEVREIVADAVQIWKLPPFNAGEIQSFIIYPL